MLATRAAIQLDNLRRGVDTDRAAIGQLAELLKNSFDQSGIDAGHRRESLLDAPTIVLMGKVLTATQSLRMTNKDLLKNLLNGIGDELERVADDSAGQPLEHLRDFCVALARESASYQRSLRDVGPSHPFKKY
jgi:hypothetical protein